MNTEDSLGSGFRKARDFQYEDGIKSRYKMKFHNVSNINSIKSYKYTNSYENLTKTKKIRICSNCRVTSTPSWRKSPDGNQLLCNACGLYQKLHSISRPFSVTPEGRTKAIKKDFISLPCYYCKSPFGCYRRQDVGNKNICDLCYNRVQQTGAGVSASMSYHQRHGADLHQASHGSSQDCFPPIFDNFALSHKGEGVNNYEDIFYYGEHDLKGIDHINQIGYTCTRNLEYLHADDVGRAESYEAEHMYPKNYFARDSATLYHGSFHSKRPSNYDFPTNNASEHKYNVISLPESDGIKFGLPHSRLSSPKKDKSFYDISYPKDLGGS